MKKLLTLAAIFALAFTACPTDGGKGNENGNGNTKTTTLRIKNESSKTIRNVVWNNVAFNDANTPIISGNSIVKTLEEGTGYIFFDFYSVSYRSSSVVAVEKDENAEFTFTNNTVIIEVDNTTNSITIGSLPIPPTTLTVINSTSYGFFTVKFGDIDFFQVDPDSGNFSSLASGGSITKEVSAGTRNMEISVYFGIGFKVMYLTVAEAINCEDGMPKQFTVTNNTIVTNWKDEQGPFKSIVDAMIETDKHGEK